MGVHQNGAVSRRLPGRSAEQYEYRGFPQLVRYEDGEHAIEFQYDNGGRLLSRTDENGHVISELEWDADADCPWGEGYLRRIKSEVSVDGTSTERTFTYDRFGRLASALLDLDNGSRQFRVDKRFDEIGRLAEIRHGGPGPRISYEHDSVGTLSQIRVGDAPVWTATSRDVSGAVDGIEFGNGLREERSYHAGVLEWLTLLADDPVIAYPGSPDASTVVDSVSLGYDAVGRMARKEVPHLGVEETYDHDDLGRLLRVDYAHDGQPTAEMVHEYSPIGSVLSRSGVGNFVYGDSQRPLSVTAAGSVTYAYDTNGRQTDRDGTALTWNAWSKLDHVHDGQGLHIEFAYDGYGKKVRRTEFGPEPSVTYFADGLDVKVEGEGETRRYRVSGPEGVVAVVVQTADAEETLYTHGNEMGSTTVFTNQNGDVVERQDFDPFGRRRAPLGGAAGWSGDSEVDIGFTGHRREESFGLMDMGGRYYDPHLARFAAPDPFVSAPSSSQGYDPFSYVRNDPLTYTDPTGYVPLSEYSGDWQADGDVDADGIQWYTCIEGCGDVDIVGVHADSFVESGEAYLDRVADSGSVELADPTDDPVFDEYISEEPGHLWLMPADSPALVPSGRRMTPEGAAQIRDILETKLWGSHAGTLMNVYVATWEFTTGLDHPYNNGPVDPTNLPKPGGVKGAKISKIADTPVHGDPTHATVAVRTLKGRQMRSEYNGSEIRKIKKNMKENGYDQSKPIDIAEVDGKRIIINGHHRARAAGATGIKQVPVRIWKVDEKTGSNLYLQAAEAAHSLGLPF